MIGVLLKRENMDIETEMHRRGKRFEEVLVEDVHLQAQETGLEQIVPSHPTLLNILILDF